MNKESIVERYNDIQLYVPWVSTEIETKDLNEKLSMLKTARFIFNEFNK